MGISKAKLGKFVRAATVSGLLGLGGTLMVATPAHAGSSDPSDPTAGPSDPSDPSDPGTTPDESSTDADVESEVIDASTTGGGTLASTGGDFGGLLLLGGAATATAVGIRRLLRS